MGCHDDTEPGAPNAPVPEQIPAPPTVNPYRTPPLAPEPEGWRDRAACAEADPEAWFPLQGSGGSRAARLICESCPVQGACLATALTRNEHGIWGGLTERQRRNLTPTRRRELIAAGTPNTGRNTA